MPLYSHNILLWLQQGIFGYRRILLSHVHIVHWSGAASGSTGTILDLKLLIADTLRRRGVVELSRHITIKTCFSFIAQFAFIFISPEAGRSRIWPFRKAICSTGRHRGHGVQNLIRAFYANSLNTKPWNLKRFKISKFLFTFSTVL